MHAHAPASRPGSLPAAIARRLADRARIIADARRPGRHQLTGPWTGLQPGSLDPGRVPEESYRDYQFRQDVWSAAA